jgi:malate dehydrogenase
MISDIRNYWKRLRSYKSRSQFGIAKNTYDVINTIINSKELVIPASVVLEGEYGENNIAMGVPVKINQKGILEIQKINLDEFELALLRDSSNKIHNYINSV